MKRNNWSAAQCRPVTIITTLTYFSITFKISELQFFHSIFILFFVNHWFANYIQDMSCRAISLHWKVHPKVDPSFSMFNHWKVGKHGLWLRHGLRRVQSCFDHDFRIHIWAFLMLKSTVICWGIQGQSLYCQFNHMDTYRELKWCYAQTLGANCKLTGIIMLWVLEGMPVTMTTEAKWVVRLHYFGAYPL